QFINEMGHALRAAPTHNVRWDFIDDIVSEHGGMAATGINGAANRFASGGAVLGRIEESKMLAPGNIDQQMQLVLGGKVEKPFRRRMIDAEQVGAELADLLEIRGGLFR